jgi:hypothetical protein
MFIQMKVKCYLGDCNKIRTKEHRLYTLNSKQQLAQW